MRYSFWILMLSIPAFAQAQENMLPLNRPGIIENSPALSPDASHLLYVSGRDTSWKFYSVELIDSGINSQPLPDETLNTLLPSYRSLEGPFYSYDGTMLLFSALLPGGFGGMDIWICHAQGNGWSKPENAGSIINSTYDEESPSMNSLNNRIYFTRNDLKQVDQPKLCRKIYYADKDSTGNWIHPLPVPKRVNLDCEMCPRISSDNLTLFFSSLREGGKGGFDIYYSRLVAGNIWIEPLPVDTINTAMDELYPSLDYDGSALVFKRASPKNDSELGNIFMHTMEDRYRPDPIQSLSGTTHDMLTGSPMAANITIISQGSSKVYHHTRSSPADGDFRLFLNTGSQYTIDFTQPGFSHYILSVDASKREYSSSSIEVSLYSSINLIVNVFDADLIEPLQANFTISNAITGANLDIPVRQVAPGRYAIELPIGGTYLFKFEKENFESSEFRFDLNTLVQFNTFERDVLLVPSRQEYEIHVADMETSEGVDVEIVLTNLEKNETIVQKPTKNKEGKYVVHLRKGDKYEVSVNSPKGYAFYTTKVDLASADSAEKLDVKLTPLKPKTKLTLNDITFESNSAGLNVSSFSELDRVVKLMNDNPGIHIEIAAHTDDVGSDTYNLKLSDKRAESVVNYLIEKSIPVSRLVYKGYGESVPLVPNADDESRAKNRRVELKIIDIIQDGK
jgi:outer membrane protein OmpA-like peptidoglycan-associated protein/Tol biopolymer transport system component